MKEQIEMSVDQIVDDSSFRQVYNAHDDSEDFAIDYENMSKHKNCTTIE